MPLSQGNIEPGRVHKRSWHDYLEQELDRGLPGRVVETLMQVSDTETQKQSSSRVLYLGGFCLDMINDQMWISAP